MLIRCGYRIAIHCAQPTALVLMLTPHDDDVRARPLVEARHNSLNTPTTFYMDSFGNRCQRLVAPAGALVLSGDAIVDCDDLIDPQCLDAAEIPVADLPADVLVHLMGSRYCETDQLSQFAWNRFGALPPGWCRVQAIVDFVQNHIEFDYASASATRTARDTLENRVGVCRDFAHLAITLCRCLNIPARYVNGHLGDIGVPVVDPMDFSAWMEVYLGGGWHAFDPRNNARRIGRIVIARGRDAADVPLINSFGPHDLTDFKVWTYQVADDAALPVTWQPPAPPKASA